MNGSRPVPRGSRGYDRLGPWYEWVEWLRFGRRLQVWRTCLLDRLPPPDSALVLGDGDGRFLRALLDHMDGCLPSIVNASGSEEAQPSGPRPAVQPPGELRVESLDFSSVMLRLQQKRIAGHRLGHRVTWRHEDLREAVLEGDTYELVTAIFCLDALTPVELTELTRRIARALRADGKLYVVDFAEPVVSGMPRVWARGWLRVMHTFFGWVAQHPTRALVPLRPALRSAGLEMVECQRDRWGWLEASIWCRASIASDTGINEPLG